MECEQRGHCCHGEGEEEEREKVSGLVGHDSREMRVAAAAVGHEHAAVYFVVCNEVRGDEAGDAGGGVQLMAQGAALEGREAHLQERNAAVALLSEYCAREE